MYYDVPTILNSIIVENILKQIQSNRSGNKVKVKGVSTVLHNSCREFSTCKEAIYK